MSARSAPGRTRAPDRERWLLNVDSPYERQPYRTRPCAERSCTAAFTTQDPRRLYCSPSCRYRARRTRHEEVCP